MRPSPAARFAGRFALPAVACLLVLAVAAGCGRGGRGRTVTVKGSDTMVILGQKWADVYMKGHPGATVAVTGGGSGTGIAALINGTTDIAEASRPMTDEERQKAAQTTGGTIEEHPVARDGVTIYVNESNPLIAIQVPDLAGIYTGRITNWKEIGGPDQAITVYSRENNSGTYVFFKEHVLKGADYMPGAQTLPGTAAVVNAVGKDPGGIGYGGIGYGSGIKHLAVVGADGQPVEPSEATIASGTYPLSRPLYWYMSSTVPQAARDLLAWVLSPEGQKVVTEVGYFPLQQ